MGIRFGSHISLLAGLYDDHFDDVDPEIDAIREDFPTLLESVGNDMKCAIANAKSEGDSVGGEIECAITGLPAGIGEPMFCGVESHMAQILYGIPAVKYVEFGAGVLCAYDRGSELNDSFVAENNIIKTKTNYSGGILGGITTGMPVIFRVGIKPTPSISLPQKSINLKTMEEVTLQVKGRHDPCIVPRAVPVVEAAAAIAIFDLILGNTQTDRRK